MNKQLVHSKFEEVASTYPDSIAIEYADVEIKYGQLNAYANKVAGALAACGYRKGSIAGAYFENGPAYVLSIIGINKAGLAFMPMEPGFPLQRLVNLVRGAEPAVVVTHEELLPAVVGLLREAEGQGEGVAWPDRILAIRLEQGELKAAVYDRRGNWLKDAEPVAENLEVELDGNDTNYIIYTSGSTGQPKMIEGCHKGLSHFIHWEIGQFGIGQGARVTQLSPLSFDVSFRDIFVPLLAGGTLCIPEKGIRFQPQRLLQWIVASRITLVHSVPTLFRLLTEELKTLPEPQAALKELKHILLAGEPLFGRDVLGWRSLAGEQTVLVNIYGPSETTLAKMFHPVTEADINPASIVPLGRPISNTAILILKDGRLCRPGEPGNIYIKTPFRSKGYFRNAALTAEKFVQNPLHADFNDIIYDTGDTGKYLEDSTVVFLGRNDNQVKIRGNRIELLEVEKVLAGFPGIKEAILQVIVNEQEEDAVLACYYTGSKVDEAKIKEYLGRFLVQYMHPSYYIRLKEFPLNSSGKVDRKALPKPVSVQKEDHEAPVGELEQKLEKIWMEVLKLPKVSRTDSFFNIGGSSLKGIKIISKIYKECNVLIKLPDLFMHSSISQLAAFLEGADQKSYREIKPLEARPHYELSHAQRRLWLLSHFEEQHIAYNMLHAYRFQGDLKIDCMERAFRAVVERHEILRTVFIVVDGEPRQKVLSAEAYDFQLEEEDLRRERDAEARARKIAEAQWATPFDLERGPLFRVKLLYLPGDEFIFIFSIHHIISDGWSSAVWVKEVCELYDVYSSGGVEALKPLKIQYKDFAAWQNGLLDGNKLNKYQDYWIGQFTPVPPFLELPADKPRPKVKTYNGGHFGLRLDKGELTALQGIGNKGEATLFMTLLSTLNVLFFRLTGQSDITIGTPITGREHEDLEDQIGLYVNTLALRSRFEAHHNFMDILKQVKQVASGAYAHQAYPFDYLVDQLNLERDMSRSPLFDVMIVLHDSKAGKEQQPQAKMSDVAVGHYYVRPAATKFDLNFNFTEHTEWVNLEIEYNSDVFSHGYIADLCKLYKQLLQAVAGAPEEAISRLQLLGAEEIKPLRGDAGFEIPVDPKLTISQLFEERVALAPDAIALEFGGVRLSYGELQERVLALSGYLRGVHGVGEGDMVAVMLERSVTYIVSVLGILKAGAAFVPVDVDYPAGRIDAILENLGPKLVISEREYADKIPGKALRMLFAEEQEALVGYGVEQGARKSGTWEHGVREKGTWKNGTGKNSMGESGTRFSGGGDILPTGEGSDLAYVIYTSGSTGAPKGVAIEQSSLVNYIRWANKYYFDDRQGHVFAFNTSISFDLTLTSIFTTLLRGDKVVIYNNALGTGDALREIFDPGSGIGVAKLTPSHINLLGNLELEETKVGIVIVGGEMLYEQQVAILRRLNPDIRVFNEYGPTEATVGCIVREIGFQKEKITIGSPISQTGIYILDAYGNLQPRGVPGELYISGAGLARGYYRNKALTDARFIPNPYGGAHDRIYATGDIGKANGDGDIELLGRKDRQVKIRGYRIELEEIEKSILESGPVREVLATVMADEQGEKHIVAYFIANGAVDAVQLRNALKKRLPLYMVPLYFTGLDKFPLTTNGKLDEKALPDPFAGSAGVRAHYVAPATKTEDALAAIWESVLGKQQISAVDDFFELGGHSLTAMRIVTKIAKELGLRLSLKNLFTYTTIQTLAAWIDQSGAGAANMRDSETSPEEEDTFII